MNGEQIGFLLKKMIQAAYFDGQSSKPNRVVLEINDFEKCLVVYLDGRLKFKWNVEDLTCERIGSYLEVRNNAYRNEFLKIEDAESVDLLFQFLKSEKRLSVYQRLIHLDSKAYIAIAIVVLAIVAAGFFIAIPWGAEKAANLLPESFDVEIGDTFADQYIDKDEIDSTKTKLMNQFASQFSWNNTKKLQFYVLTDKRVNAFALPNGDIVIYSGIIEKMHSYEELVALIGHEVSHVNNRHSTKMLCRNLSGYLFVSAVFGDVNGIMAVISQNIQNLQNLTYSRKFENEADHDGTLLIIQNQVDPKGMIDLFNRLQDDDKYTLPVFISTHPYTKDRIETISKLIHGQNLIVRKHLKAKTIFNEMSSL